MIRPAESRVNGTERPVELVMPAGVTVKAFPPISTIDFSDPLALMVYFVPDGSV